MNKKPVIAVVVTTYNRPQALAWVLDGISRQSRMPDLVVVADDGSRPTTKHLVESFQHNWSGHLHRPTLVHVWHPDDGFRAAQIRNKAVAAAMSAPPGPPDQIIFLDGDCIPLVNFVERHSKLLGTPAHRFCVAGGRSLLNSQLTATLENSAPLPDPKKHFPEKSFDGFCLLAWRLTGKINRVFNLVPLPDMGWRLANTTNWKLLRTCNVSLWSRDFLNVNGFNEAFTGWGFEDSDLAIRLIRSGVAIKNGRFATNVLHLWHREHDRSRIQSNQSILATSDSAPIYTSRGIAGHLKVTP